MGFRGKKETWIVSFNGVVLLNCGAGEVSWESLGLQGRSNQSIPKEINPEYSLEGLMLNLKLQYFGHLLGRADSLEKTLMLGKIEGKRRRSCRLNGHQFSSVQSLSSVWLFVTPWTAAHRASLSISSSWSLLKLMSIELVMPSNHIILCHPLLLLLSIFPRISIFSSDPFLQIRCPKH